MARRQDKEKRTKMWTSFRMKIFNLLLIPTVGAIFSAGVCDGDQTPPVMMTVPEVSCRSQTYLKTVCFVCCLGCLYMAAAIAMILRSLARYHHVMRETKLVVPCHQLDKEAGILKIYCAGQGGGDLHSSCLDAAQIHYQQLLGNSTLSVHDVPRDADYRSLTAPCRKESVQFKNIYREREYRGRY